MVKRRSQKLNLRKLRKSVQTFPRFALRGLPFGIVFGLAYFIFLNARNMVHADPYFQVEKVTVFPSGVLTNLELKFLEEEARGKSLLDIDLKKISRNLERNPRIRRAEVNRNLPHEVNVLLQTRAPLLEIQSQPGGKFYVIADDQIILAHLDSPKPNMMVLEDFTSKQKSFSIGTLYPNGHFRSIISFLDALKSDPIFNRETVSKMSIDQIGNINLLLSDGIELKMGKEVPTSEGVRAVLSSLLRSVRERSQILYLDLRYRDIIVKRKTDV